jgi:Zn-dependent metalloprotease
MKKLLPILLLCASTALAKDLSEARLVVVKNVDSKGVPTFVTGQLGKLPVGSIEAASRDFLRSQAPGVLKMDAGEDFQPLNSFRDELGQTHVRMQERVNGLPVIGAEYIVHSDAAGNVIAMNGRAVSGRDLPRHPSVDAWTAIEQAVSQYGIESPSYVDKPRLVYVVNERGNASLAWRATAAHKDNGFDALDVIYADATTGDAVMRDAIIQHARNRRTHNSNFTQTIPGTLVLQETSGTTTDVSIQKAHDYAGVTYNYFSTIHGRDSYNGAGATMTSSVHYGSNYNNAGWTGSQMVYGDGDGTQFGPFSRALDVVAHELTHAVTDYSADLVYQNESGALNEATSDILGVAAESWSYGSVSALTWKVGEDCYTPATAGDALRTMNDPALSGDYDYYPTRYTGTADYGGVHSNSGIANLAFYLMVTGGTHPRGKTTVVVPALNAVAATSLNMGAKIWYRALTVYMNSSTNFEGARNATAQAATDLYGAAANNTVHKAWDAVGVPGTPGGGSTVTVLTNAVAATGLSGSTGSWKHFKITVPASQTKLDIVMSGGTGDGDMYVKRGAQPTSSVWDYRPYLNGNNETVSVTNPVAGDWYISIYAYSSFASVSLKATYTAGAVCTSVTGSLSGTGASYYTTQYVSAVSGAHTGKLTGPSGTDFDLYLQKLSGATWTSVAAGETSTSTENVSYNGTAGTYRWRVYAYSGSGSFTLCTTKP